MDFLEVRAGVGVDKLYQGELYRRAALRDGAAFDGGLLGNRARSRAHAENQEGGEHRDRAATGHGGLLAMLRSITRNQRGLDARQLDKSRVE